ncbi:TIGR01621 family pseudouridine synthase [Gallibacterium melopsittaci]|uniref:TIGR01621 family pseudouridine synthase n=1 Tax=Gallibacterium melopsittaci TaxID=516063 RepID=A0ABV6HYJ8_9PAST
MIFPIIAQTADFVVIDKPQGISVHKDEQEIGLTTLLAKQLNVEQVWLVHRLDKSTSGLLLFALHKSAAAELSACFAQHQVQKIYFALAQEKPKKKQGLIRGDMVRTRRGMWKLTQEQQHPAITRFYSVSCESKLRLFVLKPQTGKTHQLRVAMKSLGSPILGDPLYGNRQTTARCHLHSALLAFHFSGQFFCYTCLPTDGDFDKESVKVQMTQIIQQEIAEIQQ